MSARITASRIIKKVVEDKQQLKLALSEDNSLSSAGKDKAWIQEVCYGTLRWYLQLEYLLDQLLDRPIKRKDSILKYLLISAIYQLRFMQTPDYAVVSETVAACKTLKKESAKGMVNAVLRRYQRESDTLLAKLAQPSHLASSHPEWLFNRLKTDWPEHYQAILDANNQKPPMYLRCNNRVIKRNDYLQQLEEAGIEADTCKHTEFGIRLTNPCPVDELPGFYDGLVSVQDMAAQLASELLQLQPGLKVLDACAAPGGKSAALLEREAGLDAVTLVEKDPVRTKQIRDNLERLNLSATIKVSDLLDTDNWWNGNAFDRILLDAPCSATGVIRRLSDIKMLRTEKQIHEINKIQKQLLDCAWSVLKPGGLLLYATCSVLKQENSDTIREFIDRQSSSQIVPIAVPCSINTGYGYQILTGTGDMDGFFYAAIKKKPS